MWKLEHITFSVNSKQVHHCSTNDASVRTTNEPVSTEKPQPSYATITIERKTVRVRVFENREKE